MKSGLLGKNIDICDRIEQLKCVEGTEYHYHIKCYKSLCHQTNLERAELKGSLKILNLQCKKSVEGQARLRKTYDQELCVFCQSDSSVKHF